MAIHETHGIEIATSQLRGLLQRARVLKPATDIEPPLPTSEFQGELGLPYPPGISKTHYLAALEYAARWIYQDIASRVSISDTQFVEIWNLFDILNICGDQEQCEPSLVWWLIEELLETQSIDDCRVVFDYLESRRERLVTRHFEKKRDMVVLRAFNELLRRLSRAEESVFCGRVFLFMFQSFPLGTRSSVNGKGDFHIENVTSFELQESVEEADDGDAMMGVETTVNGEASGKLDTVSPSLSTEAVLYPAFWTMQKAFSNPPEYFKHNGMEEFKVTLKATLKKFEEVPKVNQAAADNKRGLKRKSGELDGQDEFASTFNPKYLTSRELFMLELSDLAFQRHILVQALILLDFLLSLTEGVKKKTVTIANNKPLLQNFEYTLSDADAEWAEKMRREISHFLSVGQLDNDQEGKFYHRLVETVLSRDKNWVRWKLEFCKEIKREAITSSDFASAQDGARRVCKPITLKSSPMGALDVRFLQESGPNEKNGGKYKATSSSLPDAQTLVRDVQNVDLDLDFAKTDEERENLQDAKLSKTWRALRLMSKTKLGLFSKVDDGRNLECFIQPHGTATINMEGGETVENGGESADKQPEEEAQGQHRPEPIALTAEDPKLLVESTN